MKKQQSKIEDVLTTIIAFCLSFIIVAAIWIVKKIVWPVLRFCARASWNGIRHLLAKSKVVKPSKPAAHLPTPDIFKGAPNLARARQVRF